jgi:prepilin-type processing-associated H-X9-DG protein
MNDDAELLAKSAGEGCEASSGQPGARRLGLVHVLLGSALAAALLVPLVLQYRANESLRAENAALRAQTAASDELDRLRDDNQRLALVQAEAGEVRRARSNQVELLRLRGEHAQLLQLRAEVERLRASLSAPVRPDPGPSLQQALNPTNRIACLNSVRQLSLAAIMYADDHQGVYPDARNWCEALQPYYRDVAVLRCPSDPDRPCAYAFNLKLSGLAQTNVLSPSDTVVFFEAGVDWNGAAGLESAAFRHGDFVNLGFADGSARAIRRDRLPDLIWNPAAR